MIAICASLLALFIIIFSVRFNHYYKGPISGHFDGKRFFNPGISLKSFKDFLKWKATGKPIPWPQNRRVGPPAKPSQKVSTGEILVTFVNHATFLIQWDGINILTDPIWSERASPFTWIGPKRVHPPGIKWDDLPSIDVILLSHNHYDSLDLPTLKKLKSKYDPLIVAGLGNAALLNAHGMKKIVELDWWGKTTLVGGIDLVFTPAQHFSSRWVFDQNKALWGGFFLQKDGNSLYYSGDTAYCNVFKEVAERFGPPTLAMLPIGAYEPRWFMKTVHMNPEEAVQASLDLNAPYGLAYHFGTFPLADEAIDAPQKALKNELNRLHISHEKFWILDPGEALRVL